MKYIFSMLLFVSIHAMAQDYYGSLSVQKNPTKFIVNGTIKGNVVSGPWEDYQTAKRFLIIDKQRSKDMKATAQFGVGNLQICSVNKEAYTLWYKWQGSEIRIGYIADTSDIGRIDRIVTLDGNIIMAKIGAGDGSGWGLERRGFDLIASYNGKVFFKTKDYRILQPGVATWRGSEGGYSVSNFKVSHYKRTKLVSNTDKDEVNFKDIPSFIPFQTKGSIDSGSYTISVKDASGIPIGSTVVLSTNSEGTFYGRKLGERGTLGPDGGWPELTYKTKADLLADRSQPSGQEAKILETGEVAVWRADSGGFWDIISRYRALNGVQEGPSFWYIEMMLGKVLRGIVVKKKGNLVTINKPCRFSVTNVDVTVDNVLPLASVFDPQGGTPKHVILPVGRYGFSEMITFAYHPDWSISGTKTATDSTVFFTPYGGQTLYMAVSQSPRVTIENICFKNSNDKNGGFGMQQYNRYYGDTYNGQQNGFPDKIYITLGGINIDGGSPNCIVRNCSFIDFHTTSFRTGAKHTLFENSYVYFTYGPRGYNGWAINACRKEPTNV